MINYNRLGYEIKRDFTNFLSFTRTRFKNKETKETAYLLDRVIGLGAHARMIDGVKAAILEEAVQTSYEKAGRKPVLGNVCPGKQ